jgi:putative spermidine/putrescine transport system ATP-binding protein
LEVEGQTILSAKPLDKAAGDAVAIALRPEMISLNGGGEEDAGNRLQGTIEDTTFLGSIVRTRVRLQNSVISFDTFNNPNLTLPRRDDKITIAFPRDAVLLLQPSVAAQASES